MDSNHGPRPYQGRALTKLSYAPKHARKINNNFQYNSEKAASWQAGVNGFFNLCKPFS